MITFINDFAILHLSDLHIVSHKNNNYSTALHKMIDHIFLISKDIDKIIIVVTGDLVEKGEFKKNEETIKRFFMDLKNKLGEKIVDIIFSPGNHDKKRGILTLSDSNKVNEEDFWSKFKENDWEYFEKQFEDYAQITRDIREEIFNLKPYFTGTYGIHYSKIDNYNICFISFNSAWSCMGDNDMGQLRIGRFQLDDLMDQYQEYIKNNKVDLTIALMHHPTDWLTKMEQKYLNQYMIDKYRLNTNIFLQGHIHEKDIYNWYNQNHSITTFVTGMGWDQQKELKDSGHRYSLYEINCNSGIACVKTYVSDSSGEFNDDTAVYNGNNIMFPLYVHRFLEINRLEFESNEVNYYYPNSNILENLGALGLKLSDFVCVMQDVLDGYKREWELYNCFEKNIFSSIRNLAYDENKEVHTMEINELYEKTDIYNKYEKLYNSFTEITDKQKLIYEIIERLVNYLKTINESQENDSRTFNVNEYCEHIEKFTNNQTQIFLKEKFLGFIGEFCIRLQKKLFDKKNFKNGNTIRLHFRALDDTKTLNYKKIFALTLTKDEHGEITSMKDSELTDINYHNSLIEQSFIKDKTLLFSLNPSGNNHEIKEYWKDFITIAPKCDFNECKKIVDDETVLCPYITFGITVNSDNFQEIIRNLSYIGFEKILVKLFTKFFNNIPYRIEHINHINGGNI